MDHDSYMLERLFNLANDLSNAQKTIIAKQERKLADLSHELANMKYIIEKSQEEKIFCIPLDVIRVASQEAFNVNANDAMQPSVRKIQAIKVIRDRFGYNLKEAKDIVFAICDGMTGKFIVPKDPS